MTGYHLLCLILLNVYLHFCRYNLSITTFGYYRDGIIGWLIESASHVFSLHGMPRQISILFATMCILLLTSTFFIICVFAFRFFSIHISILVTFSDSLRVVRLLVVNIMSPSIFIIFPYSTCQMVIFFITVSAVSRSFEWYSFVTLSAGLLGCFSYSSF